MNFAEEQEDLLAGGGVEIAGGLVGEEDGGLIYEGAGEGAALLLAAGEFAGSVVVAGAEADAVEGLRDAMAALGAVDFGEAEGELDAFDPPADERPPPVEAPPDVFYFPLYYSLIFPGIIIIV